VLLAISYSAVEIYVLSYVKKIIKNAVNHEEVLLLGYKEKKMIHQMQKTSLSYVQIFEGKPYSTLHLVPMIK